MRRCYSSPPTRMLSHFIIHTRRDGDCSIGGSHNRVAAVGKAAAISREDGGRWPYSKEIVNSTLAYVNLAFVNTVILWKGDS